MRSIEREHLRASLYASSDWRHLFVNLSLTLTPVFLLLKDLQRNCLAGRLTRLQPALIPDKSGKNTGRGASPSTAPQLFRAARAVNSRRLNIFNGLERVPVNEKIRLF
jgi:hypothetical protein